ncbi:MAG: hypothetical protein H6737_11160 [Alphaproteobacteria bacterium]|nr:hypothetical protein [Alphaproteobacteria bacterium]
MLVVVLSAMAGGGGSQPPTACLADRELIASCMSEPALAVRGYEDLDAARRVERVAVVVWRSVTRQNPYVEQQCRAIGETRAQVQVYHGVRPIRSETVGWHPGGFSTSSPASFPFAADGGVVLEAARSPSWEHHVYPLRDVTLAIPPGALRARLQATLSIEEKDVWVEHPIDQELACDWRERLSAEAPEP